MKEILIGDNETGKRLDALLRQTLPSASSGFLYKMLRKKNITLNGHKADGSERLAMGDVIRIFFAEETLNKFSAAKSSTSDSSISAPLVRNADYFIDCMRRIENKGKIEIVYEDADLIAINKPAGVLSQKSSPDSESVNEWLIGYLLNKGIITPDQLLTYRPSSVNRLDRNTSGLMLCACNLNAARVLSNALKGREIHKYYQCVVHGKYDSDALLRGFLYKDNSNIVKIIHDNKKVPENVKSYEMNVRILQYNNDHNVTLLEIELVTGRSHQIRAVLSDLGFPIVGDQKYFSAKNNKLLCQKFNITHQLLHAQRIEFPDDFDDRLISLQGVVLIAENMFPALF